MSETAKRLYDEALKLDDEERSVLALRLLDSVGELRRSSRRPGSKKSATG